MEFSMELRCKCGAVIKVTDNAGLYITDDHKPDSDGHRFLWQKNLHKFESTHSFCNRGNLNKIKHLVSI